MLIIQDIKATNWTSTLHSALVHNPKQWHHHSFSPFLRSHLLLCSKFCSFFLTVPLARKCQYLLPWVWEGNNMLRGSMKPPLIAPSGLLDQTIWRSLWHTLSLTATAPDSGYTASPAIGEQGDSLLSSLSWSSSCTSLSFPRDSHWEFSPQCALIHAPGL